MSRHESIVNKNIVTATTMTVTYFPHVATPVPKFHAIDQTQLRDVPVAYHLSSLHDFLLLVYMWSVVLDPDDLTTTFSILFNWQIGDVTSFI